MFTFINIVAAVVGLLIGMAIGKRYEKRLEEAGEETLTTYTPNGVILLDGETGKMEDVVHPVSKTPFGGLKQKKKKRTF